MTRSIRLLTALGVWACAAALLVVGGLLAWRRLAGAVNVPLSTAALLLTGAAFGALCLLLRWAFVRLLFDAPLWQSHLVRWAPLPAAALLAAGVLLAGTPLVAACLFVGLLAAVETWCQTRLAWPKLFHWSSREDRLGDRPDDPALEQQFTRRREPDGAELINGTLRIRLAPGQRTAEAHVAFCLPFQRRPHFEHEVVAGPAARVVVGQLLPMGARLDVKLDRQAEEEESVLVRFTARGDVAAASESDALSAAS